MFTWLHHLLNPHCEDCRLEHECKSCDILREQLIELRADNKKLLNELLKGDEKVEIKLEPPKLIKSKYVPFNVRRQALEQADRIKAQEARASAAILAEVQKKSIEELEKDMKLDLSGTKNA